MKKFALLVVTAILVIKGFDFLLFHKGGIYQLMGLILLFFASPLVMVCKDIFITKK